MQDAITVPHCCHTYITGMWNHPFSKQKRNLAENNEGQVALCMAAILNYSKKNIEIYNTWVQCNLPTKFHENWRTLLLDDFAWFYRRHALKRTAGLKSVINNRESPLEYFNLFLCDIDFEFLAQQINNYAQQYISSTHLKPHSRYNKWQETNSTEIKIHLSYHTDGTGTSVGYQIILEYRDCYPIFPKCLAQGRIFVTDDVFEFE